MIEKDYSKSISINKQCDLLSLSKSSLYYKNWLSDADYEIMWVIDLIYTEHSYYGTRRMCAELANRGIFIGRKLARKYMIIMCIEAIYPHKKTSIWNKQHKKYPYLLKDLEINRANQVRSTDITYIKIPWWFVYLMAVIDWYSRYIIAWDIGINMDKEFCLWVLNKALEKWTPEIFNSDQWSQFTCNEFVDTIEWAWTQVSMDWKGRCYDNIRTERLWRTIKYEDIFLHDYQTPNDVFHGLSLYINKYNNSRLHQSLDYSTPWSYYRNSIESNIE